METRPSVHVCDCFLSDVSGLWVSTLQCWSGGRSVERPLEGSKRRAVRVVGGSETIKRPDVDLVSAIEERSVFRWRKSRLHSMDANLDAENATATEEMA